MFLDEELLKIVEETEINSGYDIIKLNDIICNKCQDYYKEKIIPSQTSYKEAKVILNKTFNLFDSFVRLCKKHKSPIVNIMGDMFEKHTFKSQFLQNERMAEIYNKL